MINLIRLRWAVRAVMMLGILASLAANVLHAQPNIVSRAIAAWPPVALLLTVELISRIPTSRRWQSATRATSTALIAVIAAWVSYWHMVAVAARYGERDQGAAYLLPLTVDGLMVVASVCLVELTGRLRAAVEVGTEPTGYAEPAADLNDAQRAALELVDKHHLDVEQLHNIAFYFQPERLAA